MLKRFLEFLKAYKNEAEKKRVQNILKSINKDSII
jgi:hypothetical protein